ncbi:hypothetical protein D7B24_005208 [Verticillium nonalfalfae]|uniref:Rhodopsin domain-containing protein n=1 Tax=Verticillium nonalfalfae TaxID=1051616 RepID=A0A3M9YC13_9PEZI|nr:uncharacterized protein D7B24_005208 [Verticillium nonalfalfae]RNJ58063.1 hypothetical protein D7B24_005208 [Verticillium nonalfalfae]
MSHLAVETWTWLSRRLLQGSFKKLQADDALMMFAMLCDTVLIVGMNIIARTNSNLIAPGTDLNFTAEDIAERESGSKWVLVVEQMQCAVIWSVKGCFLIMYNRLTMSLKQNLAVKIVAGYVAVGFIVMEILYFGVWCRPFTQYWAVPPDNIQCSAATNHLITNAVINISSDVMIILIPMPLFLQSQIPQKKKMILCGVFALGAFTILSAILNKYYSFNEPFGSAWTFWYIRESSTALIVANLPMTWTILRRLFHLKSFNGKSSNQRSGYPSSTSHFRSMAYSRNPQSTIRGGDHDLDPSASEEQINGGFGGIPLKIYQQHKVEVTSHEVGPHDGRRSSDGSLREGVTVTVTTGHRSDHDTRDLETSSSNICDEAKCVSEEIFREWKILRGRIHDKEHNAVLTNALAHLFEHSPLDARHLFFDKCWKKTQQYFLKCDPGSTTPLPIARLARQDVANMVAEAKGVATVGGYPYTEAGIELCAAIRGMRFKMRETNTIESLRYLNSMRLVYELFFDLLAPLLCQKNLNDPGMLAAFLVSRAEDHPAAFARADFRQMYVGLANRWFSPFACFLGTEMSLDEPDLTTNASGAGKEDWKLEATQLKEHTQTYGRLFDFSAQYWRSNGHAEWAPIGAKYTRLKMTPVTGGNDTKRQEFLETAGEVERRLNKKLCNARSREAASKIESDKAGRTYSFLDGFAVLSAQNYMLHFLNVVCFDAIMKWSNHAEQSPGQLSWITEDLAQYRELQMRERCTGTDKPWADLGLHLGDPRGISSEQARYQPYTKPHRGSDSTGAKPLVIPSLEAQRLESITMFQELMKDSSTFKTMFKIELEHHHGWIRDKKDQVLENLDKASNMPQAVVTEVTLDIIERVFRRRILDVELFHFVHEQYNRFTESPASLSASDWLFLQVHAREFASHYWHDLSRRGIWHAHPRWRQCFRRSTKFRSIANGLPQYLLPVGMETQDQQKWFVLNDDSANADEELKQLFNLTGHLMHRFVTQKEAASFVGLGNLLDTLTPLLPRLRQHEFISDYVFKTIENLNICVQMVKQLDLHRDGERDLRPYLDSGPGQSSEPPRSALPQEAAAPVVAEPPPVPAEPLPPLAPDTWRIFDNIFGGYENYSMSQLVQAFKAIGWRVEQSENGLNFLWSPECRLPAPVNSMAMQIHPYKHKKPTAKVQSEAWKSGNRNRFEERGVSQQSLQTHYSGCPGWHRPKYDLEPAT